MGDDSGPLREHVLGYVDVDGEVGYGLCVSAFSASTICVSCGACSGFGVCAKDLDLHVGSSEVVDEEPPELVRVVVEDGVVAVDALDLLLEFGSGRFGAASGVGWREEYVGIRCCVEVPRR